jgi:hypothetical protein
MARHLPRAMIPHPPAEHKEPEREAGDVVCFISMS